MAEIRDELILEIDQALRDVNRVEAALDRALAPVEVKVEVDERGLQNLESTLQDVQRIADRAATETQSIALAAGKAEVNFEDLARAMGVSEDEARRLSREILESQAAANKLEDAARDVARQLGLSDQEAERLTRSLRTADTAAAAINTTTGQVVTGFGSLRTAAAGIATAFAAIGGAQLLGAAVRGANTAIQSFARLEDSINAVNVVFDEGAEAVLNFGETAAQSAGLSQEAFNQAVVPIGSLLQNFGFDAREAADASVVLVQRAADLASVMGGTVQEALLAVGAALRGEADPLERYGASVSAARVEQFALAAGLAATKAEIDPAITLQARYGLILADTARVAGDFVNTSDDLANAQRTAAAEAQNLVAQVGEALAPAFEAILVQAPQLLAFFGSLVPQLGATADEASRAASGLTEIVSATTFGFGQIGDSVAGIGDIVQGAVAAIDDVAGALTGDFDFSGVNAQLDQFNQRLANTAIRIASQSIPASMAKGMTAVNAFGQAIAFLAQQDDSLETVQQAFDRLRIQTQLTDQETRSVVIALIDQAAVLGLNADEVRFLNDELEILNNNLFVVGNEVAQAGRAMLVDLPFETVTSRFTTFTSDLEEVPARIDSITVRAALAAEGLLRAVNPFDDDPKVFTQSIKQFFAGVTEDINREAIFQQGIVQLILAGRFDLARMLSDLESGSQPQLTAFLENLDFAKQVDDALRTGETDVSTAVGKFLEDQIAAIPPGPIRDELVKLLEEDVINSPQAEAGIVRGVRRSVAPIGDGYRRAIEDIANQVIPEGGELIGDAIETHWRLEEEANTAATITANSFLQGVEDVVTPDAVKTALALFGIEIDLTAEGAQASDSFWDAFVADSGASSTTTSVRDAIESTIRSGAEMQSPSKLALRLGEEMGDSFWLGFAQAQVPGFDQLNVEQILSLNLDPTTQVFTGFDPLTVGQLQQLMDEALAKVEPSTEIQFDFDLQALQEELAALADLTGTAGTEAREAFMAGLSTLNTEEITRLRASILDAVNEAIEAGSPSQLFIRIGENAGNSFWDGFGQAELTLRTPTSQPTGGLVTTSGTGQTVGGDVNVNINLDNARLNDPVSDVARMAQIAGSVAHTYNQVRN